MGFQSQNLIQLLKTRGFMSQIPVTVNGNIVHVNSYGTPGTLLRHNIKKQWWRAMVLLQSNVFPVEASPFRPDDLSSLLNGSAETEPSKTIGKRLQSDCQNKYLDVLTLANSRLPFSIASIGEGLCHASMNNCTVTDQEKSLFLQRPTATEMLLQNYIPPSGVSRVLDYWLQTRLTWWKRLSKNPSKFRVTSADDQSDGTNSASPTNAINGQRMSIVYDFSWGPETLEHVHSVGDENLRSLQEDSGTSYMAKPLSTAKSVLPHCIECTASLDKAMVAFLVDGYHERKSLAKSKSKTQTIPLLQLHPHLSPFHVALVVTSGTAATTTRELCHVSQQLEKDLKIAGLSVFNASEHVGTLNAHFKRNDQLGIPYTLIFNENTLADGIISSRDRDTEIKKPVHVSKAVEEISRNVKATLD